jgi:hypothetical protein
VSVLVASAMLAIVATAAVVAACFAGIGLLVRRAWGLTALDVDDCFLAFWVGFAMATLFLLIWNFFFPVGLIALLFVLMAGAAGLACCWRSLAAVGAARERRPTWLSGSLLTFAILWIANQATGAFRSYDGALYHLQGIQWAKAFPVIPGIANLHGPLAFNNSSFLYDAMLDSGWWEGRGFHIANGVLVFVMAVQAILAGARVARAGPNAQPAYLYRFLLLAPVLYLVPLNGGITSYSTDLPLTLILLMATATMYRLLDAGGKTTPTRNDAYAVFAVAVLLATAVTIKATAAVFAAAALPVTLWLWWKRPHAENVRPRRTVVATALAVAVFAVVWVVRGIVMSGYPVFPLSIAGLPVDWRAPAEHADAEFAFLAFTEREFTWSIIGRDWLRLALWDDAYAVMVPASLAVAALATWYVTVSRRGSTVEPNRLPWWILPPVCVALVSWLLSAPSTRYCPALFWTAAAVSIAECQRALWPSLAARGRQAAVVAVALFGISPLVAEPVRSALQRGRNPAAALLAHNFVAPPPGDALQTIRSKVEVTPFRTRSGLALNRPVRKPDPNSLPNACWNAPIPCTPNPAPNLALREPGNLRGGFRVTGDWQMLDWPYYWTAEFLSQWRQRKSIAMSRR